MLEIIYKISALEAANTKITVEDLLVLTGGSKTILSIDGKVAIYFEKKEGKVRYIGRIVIPNGNIVKKSTRLSEVISKIKIYLPKFPDFEPEDISETPQNPICLASQYALLELLKLKQSDLESLMKWLPANYNPPTIHGNDSIITVLRSYVDQRLKEGRRSKTVRNVQFAVESFLRFSNINVLSDITPSRLQKFYNTKGRTALEYLKRLNCFFHWLVKFNYLSDNPNKTVVIEERNNKKALFSPILIIPAVRAIMDWVEKEANPNVTAVFALMLFCGIRPYEVNFQKYGKTLKYLNNNQKETDSMRWKDIDYDHRRIHIRAECSKCGYEAMIIDAPDNLWAWLDTVPLSVRSANNGENRIGFSQAVIRTYKCKANNYVKKIGFEDSKDDIILKRTHLLVYDVMRHSFCTYASLHTNIGSEKALKIARHSKAIDVQHYQGVVTNKNDAVDYFNIYPRQLALPNATNRVLALPNSLRLLTQKPTLLLEPPKDN